MTDLSDRETWLSDSAAGSGQSTTLPLAVGREHCAMTLVHYPLYSCLGKDTLH